MARVFIDTNIFLYAADPVTDPAKCQRARSLLEDFYLGSSRASISVQVLKEYAVQMARRGRTRHEVVELLAPLLEWQVVPNSVDVFRLGLSLWERFQLSFWDAHIVAAALAAEADELWTEDLQTGQCYGSLKIVNPL